MVGEAGGDYVVVVTADTQATDLDDVFEFCLGEASAAVDIPHYHFGGLGTSTHYEDSAIIRQTHN